MRLKNLIISTLLALPLPAIAQIHFSPGAVGGVRLTDGANNGLRDESRRYTVGPSAEVSFGEHLAVEVDALYKRFGYSYVSTYIFSLDPSASAIPLVTVTRSRTHSVEAPVMGKYYFGRKDALNRFFVSTGYSFQHSWSTSEQGVVSMPPSMAYGSASIGSGARTMIGAAFGAGWARKAGPLTLQPSIRYTHWGSRSDSANRNQVDALLGIRF